MVILGSSHRVHFAFDSQARGATTPAAGEVPRSPKFSFDVSNLTAAEASSGTRAGKDQKPTKAASTAESTTDVRSSLFRSADAIKNGSYASPAAKPLKHNKDPSTKKLAVDIVNVPEDNLPKASPSGRLLQSPKARAKHDANKKSKKSRLKNIKDTGINNRSKVWEKKRVTGVEERQDETVEFENDEKND